MLSSLLFMALGVYFIGLHLIVPTFDSGTPRSAKIATRLAWPVALIFSMRRWKQGKGKFLRVKGK